MEFWGVEVKPGETVKCNPGEDKYLHLSQASIGESKSKGNENVPVFVKVNAQKLVLGTLSLEKCPQISYDLVFEKDFELCHNSKSVSVHFCGYKSTAPDEQSEGDDYPESQPEPEDVPVGQNSNGKPIVKQDQRKPGLAKASAMKEDISASKKAKKAEPAKAGKPKVEDGDGDGDEDDDDDDDEDEDDSEEDSEDDEDMVGAMNDSDDEDEDESSNKDDEETPKNVIAVTGKRPAESTSKTLTPAPEKKAKFTTPAGQKTGNDGKKGGHTATPHPAKQAGKAPANSDKSKQQTPKSAGSVACKSCSRTFNSENALQSHTKAKHGGT